jgi:hypothetical protein
MNYKIAIIFLLSVLFHSVAFAQKAYDMVRYEAKTATQVFKLAIADGYLEASELKVTDNQTKKTSNYIICPNEDSTDDKLIFCAFINDKVDLQKKLILTLGELDGSLPNSLSGKFMDGNKKETLSFSKKLNK